MYVFLFVYVCMCTYTMWEQCISICIGVGICVCIFICMWMYIYFRAGLCVAASIAAVWIVNGFVNPVRDFSKVLGNPVGGGVQPSSLPGVWADTGPLPNFLASSSIIDGGRGVSQRSLISHCLFSSARRLPWVQESTRFYCEATLHLLPLVVLLVVYGRHDLSFVSPGQLKPRRQFFDIEETRSELSTPMSI